MSMICALLQVSEAYREARPLSASRLSTLVFGDGKVLPELAAGARDITTRRAENAMIWFSKNWPAEALWPPGVARPEPAVETPDPDGDDPESERAA